MSTPTSLTTEQKEVLVAAAQRDQDAIAKVCYAVGACLVGQLRHVPDDAPERDRVMYILRELLEYRYEPKLHFPEGPADRFRVTGWHIIVFEKYNDDLPLGWEDGVGYEIDVMRLWTVLAAGSTDLTQAQIRYSCSRGDDDWNDTQAAIKIQGCCDGVPILVAIYPVAPSNIDDDEHYPFRDEWAFGAPL